MRALQSDFFPTIEPPSSIDELMGRAALLMGQSFTEICESLGVAVQTLSKRHKGGAGELIERALGGQNDNEDKPDIPGLNVEVKTVPIDDRGRADESTYICRVQMDGLDENTWVDSRAYCKTRLILFVLVDPAKHIDFAQREVGLSFLWSPTPEQDHYLEADWNDATSMIHSGFRESLSAHRGQVMQVRPKGRTAEDQVLLRSSSGTQSIKSAGFYFRARFTNLFLSAIQSGDIEAQQKLGIKAVSTDF